MLADAGCDLMFMPEVGEIYPNGAAQATRVEVPGISDILCGEFRPGHFEGVATVVAKLFHIVDPDVAIFGEKDFQQLTVIRRMVADLCLRVEIVGAPTVREADGLAMSSRNQYLDEAQRRRRRLSTGSCSRRWRRCESGVRDFARIEAAGRAALDGAGFRTDYFSVRDAQYARAGEAGHEALRGADRRAPWQSATDRQPAVHRDSKLARCGARVFGQRPRHVFAHQRRRIVARARPARRCSRAWPARCRAPPRCCAASARSRCGGWPNLRCARGTPLRSSANSSSRREASSRWRTLKSGWAAARANLFQGHTSWQSSQP